MVVLQVDIDVSEELWFEPHVRVNDFDIRLNKIASLLNIEAGWYSETSVSAYRTARCQYTEGWALNNANRQNQEA